MLNLGNNIVYLYNGVVHLRNRLFGDVTAVIVALVLFVVTVAAVVVVVVVGCGRSSRGRLNGPLQYVLFESRDGRRRRRRCAVGAITVVDVRDGCNVADDVESDVNGFAVAATAVVVVAVLALRLGGACRFRRGGSGAVPPPVRRQVGRTLKHLVALGTRVPDVHDAPTPVTGQREGVDVPDTAQPAPVRAQRVRDALDLATSLVGGHDHVELGVDVAAVVVVVGVLCCRGAVGHRRRVRR